MVDSNDGLVRVDLRAAVGGNLLARRLVAAAAFFPVVALTGRGAVSGLASRALLDADAGAGLLQRRCAGGTGGDQVHCALSKTRQVELDRSI